MNRFVEDQLEDRKQVSVACYSIGVGGLEEELRVGLSASG